MSTYKEIADRANVSIGTVYRVAHNRGRVAKETARRVREAIDELGYERNIYASNLSRKKEYRFGVLMPRTHLNSGYWEAPFRGAEQAGRELARYRVGVEAFLYDENSPRSFDHHAQKAADAELDGILVAAVVARASTEIAGRLPPELPRVYFDSYIADPAAAGFVGQDSYSSGRLAGHLMSMMLPADAPVIALRTYPGDPETDVETCHIPDRIRGFRDCAAERRGLTVTTVAVNASLGAAGFVEAIGPALIACPGVAGVFVSNSETHLAVDAMKQLGHRDDMRYVGYDLVEPNRRYLVDGTIDFLLGQRPYEQGYRGVHLLHRHVVLKEEAPGPIVLPTDIFTRENPGSLPEISDNEARAKKAQLS